MAGMTLTEVVMASSIAIVVVGSLLAIVHLVAVQQREGLVAANLQEQADLLEDKITRLIREMSATQAVALGAPVSAGSPFYRSIIVAQGAPPVAREQLIYNPNAYTCAHIPNTSSPVVQETYYTNSSTAVLRDMYFYISEKNDGAPDASAITVVFKLDDNATGERSRTNVLSRSFTATMRNN
jgi:hypothetical protein